MYHCIGTALSQWIGWILDVESRQSDARAFWGAGSVGAHSIPNDIKGLGWFSVRDRLSLPDLLPTLYFSRFASNVSVSAPHPRRPSRLVIVCRYGHSGPLPA